MDNHTSTKERLLTILKKESSSSMKGIMEHFDVSEIAIRRHLRDLVRQQLVEERSVKQDIGRPFHVYSLTSKGHETFPNQYKELPVEFLQDLEALQGEAVVKDLLSKRREREEDYYVSKLSSNDFIKRIKELVDLQTEKGYMIELNETEDGFEITNYNCPIFNVASSYVQVCSNEKEMLEKIFPNSKVESHSKIAEGDSHCKWSISKPN